MTFLLALLFVPIAAFAQSQLPAWAALGHARFPCLPAVVLYFALNRDWTVALGVAVFAGVVQDMLSLMSPGASVICFVLIAAVVGWFRSVVLTDSLITLAVFGAAACLAMTFIFHLILLAQGWEFPLGWVVRKAGGNLLLGAATTPVAHRLLGCLDRLAGNRREGDVLREIY
ncbi:MAG: rod shape-determining protein MreD [Kiritimatiellia bacterium]